MLERKQKPEMLENRVAVERETELLSQVKSPLTE